MVIFTDFFKSLACFLSYFVLESFLVVCVRLTLQFFKKYFFSNNTSMPKIQSLHAREILDSRGNPTVEVELSAVDSSGELAFGVAKVPSGASTGAYEAFELRDGDVKRFGGKGVLKAVSYVNGEIFESLKGKNFEDQKSFDEALIALDGTDNKSRLGANAILGVSIAFARAMAVREGVELYQYFGEVGGNTTFTLPVPMMNVINGGKHADSGLDIQEFMLMPSGFDTFAERLRAGAEIFHMLKNILTKRVLATSVGDEGGFAPHLESNEEAFDVLLEAITAAGYTTEQVKLSVDVAASSFHEDGNYVMHERGEIVKKTNSEMLDFYASLLAKYPLVSIEDPFFEDDFDAFAKMQSRFGDRITIVGDDLFVTNPSRIQTGIERKAANSVLIKMNQIGTVSETIEAIRLTQSVGWKPIISHRSGETEDTTLADLCVGMNCPIVKTGSACRSERTAKYNRLLAIEERLSTP